MLSTIIVLAVIALCLFSFIKNDVEKKSKKDPFKDYNDKEFDEYLDMIFKSPQEKIKTNGYYVCRYDGDVLESVKKFTFIFIFAESGHVFRNEYIGHEELDISLMAKQIQELGSRQKLDEVFTKYSFEGNTLVMKFYGHYFSHTNKDGTVDKFGGGSHNEFSGLITNNSIVLDYNLINYNLELKEYDKIPMLQKIKFDFIEINNDEKTIIKCRVNYDQNSEYFRLNESTFLLDTKNNTKLNLIKHFGILPYPEWTRIKKDETLIVTLVFEKLPSNCETFSLVEDIIEPGGFCVENIKYNSTGSYEVEL
jgi:hypothetical protein